MSSLHNRNKKNDMLEYKMKEFKLSFDFYLKNLKEKPVSFVFFLFFMVISLIYLINGEVNSAIKDFFMLFPFMVLSMSIDIVNSELKNNFTENILFLNKVDIKKYFLYKNFHPFIISFPVFILVFLLSFIAGYNISKDIFVYLFIALYYSFLGTTVSYISKGISNFLIVFLSVILFTMFIGFGIGFDNFQALKGIKKVVLDFFLIATYPAFMEKQLFFILFYIVFCIIIYYLQVLMWKIRI